MVDKTRKRIIFSVAFLLLLFIFILLATRPPKLKQTLIYKASPAASNIQFPYLASSSSINFFTGSSFATYNTKTGSTINISPQFTFPTIDNVRWSKTGSRVVFEALNSTVSDDLYPILLNHFQLIDQSWWIYDFTSHKLALLLPENPLFNVVDAIGNASGNNYAYISSDNAVYLSTSPKKAVYKTKAGGKLIQYNNNKITIEESSGLKQISLENGVVKSLVNSNLQNAYVSTDGQTVAYETVANTNSPGNTPGELLSYVPKTGKSHKILSSFQGVMGGGNGNLYVGYTDPSGGVHFELYPAKGKDLSYSLGGILNRGSSLKSILPAKDGSVLYLSLTDNTLVRVSTHPSNISNPINHDYLIDGDYYFDGYEIHYSPSQNTYEIDITKNPYSQYQDSALSYIRSQNIDPNQIIINWRVGDGVNKVNSAVVDYSSDTSATN